jgi:cyanophycinase
VPWRSLVWVGHDLLMDDALQQAGLLGLIGGDEFHPGNEPQDEILAAAARAAQPAYVVATAAARSRDVAVSQAHRWFRQFGLDLAELPVYTKRQATDQALADAVDGAGFLYIAGGDPGLVASVLRETAVGTAMIAAWRSGAVLAGSSAGAMALCAHTLVRQAFPGHTDRRSAPGLAVVPDAAVLPHHDTFGEKWFPSARAALPEAALIGIDERTCALWRLGTWHCLGAGMVTVYAPGADRVSYATGVIAGIPQPFTG